jgi:hypothetical protein
MSDVLAIFTPTDHSHDDELLEALVAARPDRVTVLIENREAAAMGDDSATGAALRDRLAELMAMIERQTGAIVLGLAGERSRLTGWRFDRELTARTPVPA